VSAPQLTGNPGSWLVANGASPLRYGADHQFVTQVVGTHPKVCARIAGPDHALVPTVVGGYGTGNCATIARE
jgi:hypothetical protein